MKQKVCLYFGFIFYTFMLVSGELISSLKPKEVFDNFYQISQIPRCSGKEQRIGQYIKDRAEKLNLPLVQDKAGNIVVYKPASFGAQNVPTVILQAHVDIVCERKPESKHNFETDPIKLLLKDDKLSADGTTLGADNGIGAAAMLAIMSNKNLTHGPLELVFTVDEERGMAGAKKLDVSLLSGKILINLDTGYNTIVIGNAGMTKTIAQLPLSYEPATKDSITLLLNITDLLGGHSGRDINKDHISAVKLLALIIDALSSFEVQVANIQAPGILNAISNKASAQIILPANKAGLAILELNRIFDIIKKNWLKEREPELKINLCLSSLDNNTPQQVLTKQIKDRIINLLLALPSGIITPTSFKDCTPLTSSNIGFVETKDNTLIIGTSQRSLDKIDLNVAYTMVKAAFLLAGATVEQVGKYYGVQEKADSWLVKKASKAYEKAYNKLPELKISHTGLEPAIINNKISNLKSIVIGPLIDGQHTVNEVLNIPSVNNFWNFLITLIKDIAITPEV